jgi:effector-binding domain-containing protein
VPVPRRFDAEGDREIIEIPRSKALLVTYRGPYGGSAEAHQAIDAYLEKYGLTQVAPAIEEYVVGPTDETDSSKWLTRIYYLFE